MAVNWNIRQYKASFFNADGLKKAVDKGLYQAKSKFGAYVARRMQTSIRNRKKASKPGQTPTNQTGLLRDNIFFALDDRSGAVVIGPARTNQRNAFGTRGQTIPNILEKGGLVGVFEHQLDGTWGDKSFQWVRTDLRYRIREGYRSAVGRPTRIRWAYHAARPFVDRAGLMELASGKHRQILKNMIG